MRTAHKSFPTSTTRIIPTLIIYNSAVNSFFPSPSILLPVRFVPWPKPKVERTPAPSLRFRAIKDSPSTARLPDIYSFLIDRNDRSIIVKLFLFFYLFNSLDSKISQRKILSLYFKLILSI